MALLPQSQQEEVAITGRATLGKRSPVRQRLAISGEVDGIGKPPLEGGEPGQYLEWPLPLVGQGHHQGQWLVHPALGAD
ncbi:hypothetical protein D1872_341140 [compost metagenome]